MSLPGTLASFALRYTLGKSADKLIDGIEQHFSDHSQPLPRALSKANERAWQAVGLAIAGDTLFDRVRGWGHGGDMIALRDQLRAFLGNTPTGLEMSADELRARAGDDLNRLRKAGRLALLLDGTAVADDLRRYSAPSALATGAERAVAAIADGLSDAPHLTEVLRIAPPDGAPLLATAFLYFFRREVETNEELARGLMFDSQRSLAVVQERGFALLDDRTVGILDQLDALAETALDGFADMKEDLREIKKRLAEPRKAGVSYDTEDEREFLRRAREQFRLNPDRVSIEQWEQLGGVLREARWFADAGEAHETAAKVAHAARDDAAEATNHYEAYLDACAAGDWTRAFGCLRRAIELEPVRYRPFDHRRYTPLCILGGGAFGTVFHCHDEYERDDDDRPRPVAIKSFRTEVLDRDLRKVFAEALTLKKLAHPSIIGVIDQGFGDPDKQTRPYLVLEYFPGRTLDQHVAECGPLLPVPDFLAVARRVAEAVHAAHTRRRPIYHRDLKPSNVMVQRNPDGTWAVKVIDFGLAVGAAVAKVDALVSPSARSTREKSVTGTIRYAPPEQRGELPGVEVGPYSDVYAFGKTFMDALLRTVEPKSWDWERLPEGCRGALKALLEHCTAESLEHRYPNFKSVLKALADLDPSEKADRDRKVGRKRQTERAGRARVKCRLVEEGARGTPVAPVESGRDAGAKLKVTLPGGVVMHFAWCPPGSFRMGSDHPEAAKLKWSTNERPVHRVTLTKGFFMGIHPVTQTQWKAVMGTDPSHFKGPNRPVEQVSWDECREFCTKLTGGLDGRGRVRLPTEAEWEYACRAGTTTEYSFGDVLDAGAANYDARSSWNGSPTGEYREGTTDVGAFPANRWGLCDMHGNVWEWCADWYGPYAAIDQTDPQGQSNGLKPVLRGGVWCNGPEYSRAACRHKKDRKERSRYYGFRVCLRPDVLTQQPADPEGVRTRQVPER